MQEENTVLPEFRLEDPPKGDEPQSGVPVTILLPEGKVEVGRAVLERGEHWSWNIVITMNDQVPGVPGLKGLRLRSSFSLM